MFSVGEKALYTRFVWATEEEETEQVTVIRVVDADNVFIENSRGTIRRSVKSTELTKIKPRPSPFGNII